VRVALPKARLVLAGFGTDELGIGDPAQGIDARGFVADLAPLYGDARIVLCPLRAASGTRIKIIEAAMYGRAALSTAIGAEGLAFAAGREIALADEPEAFARACIELLSDGPRAARIGLAARERAIGLDSLEAMHERLAEIAGDAVSREPREALS
jgi:glycosyltransferase involved in cell wall biosynthesis